jgi:hypothetical protein
MSPRRASKNNVTLVLSSGLAAIAKTLARHANAWRAQELPTALAAFASPDDVVAALDVTSSLSHAERGEIVASLVHEHLAHGGAVSQSILFVAFAPALLAMRKRRRALGDQDLDQEVSLAFLEAMRSEAVVAAGPYASVALVRLTKAKLAQRLTRESASSDVELYDDERNYEDAAAAEADRTASEASVALEAILAESGDAVRDVLLATVAGDESLADYVTRVMPGASDSERGLVYERLRKQRSLAIVRLRAIERARASRAA